MGTIDDLCCIFVCPPKLYHGLSGIVIAKNVEFKGNVTIYQHVTIAEEDKSRMTIIGDNVVIGAAAVILNNSKIGDNCRIGAGSVVTKDFPDKAVIAGIPAKIIKYLD